MKDKARKRWVDICKCVGIITVMLAHMSFNIPGGGMRLLYCFYMPMFFVLSGYVMKEKKLEDAVFQRAKRLLIPYGIYSLILIAAACIPYTKETIHNVPNWIAGILYSRKCLYTYGSENNIIFMAREQGVLWFLTCMFVSYFLAQLCLKLRDRYRLMLLLVYLVIGFMLSKLPILLPWSFDMAFIAAIFIIFGYYINKFDFDNLSIGKRLIVLLVSFLVYCPLMILDGENNMAVRLYGQHGALSVISFLLVGMSGSLVCMSIAKLIEHFKFTAMFAAVGKNSLTLFCTHMIIFRIAEFTVADFIHNKYLYVIVAALTAIAFSFLLTYIFKKISKKIKLFSYL